MRLTFVVFTEMSTGWIIIIFFADIHIPLRMNVNHFGDPLTFHLVPSLGQNLNMSSTLVYD